MARHNSGSWEPLNLAPKANLEKQMFKSFTLEKGSACGFQLLSWDLKKKRNTPSQQMVKTKISTSTNELLTVVC